MRNTVLEKQLGTKNWLVQMNVCMTRGMVRRNTTFQRAPLAWLGASIALVLLAACTVNMGTDPLVSDWFAPPGCPSHEDGSLAIPQECCPCPWPDSCPNGWPEVPDYCRTGCEPGEPHECCMCPTAEWCTAEAGQTYKPPEWCKGKPWLLDGGVDGSSAVCPSGACAPKIPDGWLGPATLYEGFDINVEACPKGTTVWTGLAEPPPPGCAECACSTPKSICGSAPHWTISSHQCTDFDNGALWNFDPPPNWDGSCNAEKSLPAGKQCGADGFCVKSITISPPVLEQIDKTCVPSKVVKEPPIAKVASGSSLTVSGRVCIDKQAYDDLPECGSGSSLWCTPTPGPGPLCIARDGEATCPSGWPNQHVFHREVKDHRTCSECSCGPAEGASCKRKYTLFSDSMCTKEFGHWIAEDTNLPQCLWLIDGMEVGAKSMETVEHDLGACKPSGGELIGEVEKNDPFTVCCVNPAM